MIESPRTAGVGNTRESGRRLSRWAGRALVGFMLAAVVGEVVARTWLGLGDPPLSIADPEIEYLSKPGTYWRFGNRVFVNSHHMRSDEFPEHKQGPDELRVMVLGDSVVHGGGLTDQADLATERLQARLREELGRPVVVGNIAAGSWGPGNLLAYARRFGLFDADVVLIVLHGKDVGDNPTGVPVVDVDPSFPARRPPAAIAEAVSRYLIPRLQRLFGGAARHTPSLAERDEQAAADRSMRDLDALCNLAQDTGAIVLIAYVPQRVELTGELFPGHAIIARFASDKQVDFLDLCDQFREAINGPADPYRPNDSIHPSPAGQILLSEAVLPAVRKALAALSTKPVN